MGPGHCDLSIWDVWGKGMGNLFDEIDSSDELIITTEDPNAPKDTSAPKKPDPKKLDPPTKTSTPKTEEAVVTGNDLTLWERIKGFHIGVKIGLVLAILALLVVSILGCYCCCCAPAGNPYDGHGYDIENQRRASMCPTRQWPPRRSRQSGYGGSQSRKGSFRAAARLTNCKRKVTNAFRSSRH